MNGYKLYWNRRYFRLMRFVVFFQLKVDKDGHSYFASLEIKNVTVEDAGKYKVTAKNDLGESNATISLNFDSKYDFSISFLLLFVCFLLFSQILTEHTGYVKMRSIC